jgi:formylmethanofuran dehydrogenase subunit E
MTASVFPDFFAAAPTIRMIDPLATFLGAADGGMLEYRYEDAVRLAGHSCPTVASAFLMTRAALRALYIKETPRRGEIRVAVRERREAGVAGVIAAVVTLVTGATEDSGFRGLGGQFNRRDKLLFAQPLATGELIFTRLDSGRSVAVGAQLNRVPGDSRIPELMPRCLSGSASAVEEQLFRELWQERVKRLLLNHADDPSVIVLYPI